MDNLWLHFFNFYLTFFLLKKPYLKRLEARIKELGTEKGGIYELYFLSAFLSAI